MGQDAFSLFHLERKKLLCIIGITFALILAFQYFELPYGKILVPTSNPSSSSSGIFRPADSPSASEIFNNITYLNQTNSEHPLEKVNETSVYKENDTISRTVIGMNLSREVNNSYANFHSLSPAIAPTYLTPPPTTKGPLTENLSNHSEISTNPPTKALLKDSEITDSMNDERFKPLKDDVNVTSNNSSVVTVPEVTKSSLIKVPERTSISDMNKLLLQSHTSYRSMVY